MSNRPEFRYLDDYPEVIQKKLNQWSHSYEISLHGVKFYRQEDVYIFRMSVMVERTSK